MTPRTLRIQALTAVSIGLLALSACSSGATADNSAAGTNGGKVTLTLATFNQFGYEDLITEYQAAHPNITIRHKKAATSNEARASYAFRLAATRSPSAVELERICASYEKQLQRFRKDPASAAKTIKGHAMPGIDAAEQAAWTLVANALLSLDESLSKE